MNYPPTAINLLNCTPQPPTNSWSPRRSPATSPTTNAYQVGDLRLQLRRPRLARPRHQVHNLHLDAWAPGLPGSWLACWGLPRARLLLLLLVGPCTGSAAPAAPKQRLKVAHEATHRAGLRLLLLPRLLLCLLAAGASLLSCLRCTGLGNRRPAAGRRGLPPLLLLHLLQCLLCLLRNGGLLSLLGAPPASVVDQ